MPLEAKPTSGTTKMRFDLEDDHAALKEAIAGFPAAVERQLSRSRRVSEDSAIGVIFASFFATAACQPSPVADGRTLRRLRHGVALER